MPDFDLKRFIDAQDQFYDNALAEILSGQKRSHWMWFIFPQLSELCTSRMGRIYGIPTLEDAKAYIAHPELRRNLIVITQALLWLKTNDSHAIMGYPDCAKLKSCMTLFSIAAPDIPEFTAVLDKFYGGQRDTQTLEILNRQ